MLPINLIKIGLGLGKKSRVSYHNSPMHEINKMII